MLRSVYFEGELGDKFIPYMEIDCESPVQVFKCLDANFPDFKEYMIEKEEQGVGYHIEIEGNELEYVEELLMKTGPGDIIITPVPAGAKSGFGKILAAVAIVALIVWNPANIFYTKSLTAVGTGAKVGFSYSLTKVGTMAAFAAVNLGIQGISQLMLPDPSTDADQEKSYLFNGAEQNIIEGDPVPVLYGRLRVPGQPVNFELTGITSARGYGVSVGGGNTALIDTSTEGRQPQTRGNK